MITREAKYSAEKKLLVEAKSGKNNPNPEAFKLEQAQRTLDPS